MINRIRSVEYERLCSSRRHRFSPGKGQGGTNSVLGHPNPELAAWELC